MITLSDYDSTNGDARSITLPSGSIVNDSTVTARLVAAGILHFADDAASPFTEFVGAGNEFPFLVATDTPLFDKGDIDSL